TVLIIDEAHLLPAHLLEEVRLLSNFETNREKLLQVVLCGQPELLDVLEQPGFRQLKQRVSLRCSIQPMNPYETREYIKWRLRVAGAKNDSIFDSAAMRIIHAVSGGIPRIINNLCDNALLSGFSQASPTVTGDVVNAVVGLLGLSGCEFSHGSGPEFSLANSGNEYLSAFEPKPVHRVAAAGASDLYDVLDSDEPLGPIAFDAPELAAHPVATSENRRENLRYIRPEYATYGRRTGDRANPRDNVRFVIEFDEPDARNPDAEFFSRVKVTRRS
ncbi:MAG TPA: AAA family ATPase, partial [Blastocatellia bacterium]|nr:AAA family ATPase [Blastocatellia bacterium]